jgi:ketosteroid isomerase-like protein
MSQENVEVVRRGYEAFSRGDLDAWLEPVSEDAELHEVSDIPDSTVYRGHKGMRRWAESLLQLVSEWRWTPEEFIYQGDTAVLVRAHMAARSAGGDVPFEQVVFHLIEFRAGEIVCFRGFLEREEAIAAVGLSE